MKSYKRLNTNIYQKSGPVITPDYIYWKKVGVPVLVKEFGAIDYIDFSPVEPYHFAVTCSVRVQVYNPITKLVVKNLSRFRENAYGAVFRSDGKLICTGGDEGVVKLFDLSTKSLLRLFKGHSAPIHRTFFLHDKPQIASFSDDKSVKVWDIPTEKDVLTFSEHTDYVRAGATSAVLPDIVLSGAYDSTVKMYDTRTDKVALTVNHDSPVESLLFLPSGGIFLSAGGTDIKIWDAIAGGKLLGCLSQHHKTITCMRLASDNTRLLSGSLDRHVKIYDVGTFKVVHTLNYPNGILSVGVSRNDDTIVAGLVDGLLSICRREDEVKPTRGERKKASHKFASFTHEASADVVVPESKNELEAKYDQHLRKFQYSNALDCVLLPYVCKKRPEITVSVMQELMRRKALHRALKDRDPKSVATLLMFFIRNLTNYQFTRVLISVINVFLDIYEDSIHLMPVNIYHLFLQLNNLLRDETKLADELAALQGALHMILAASDVSKESAECRNELKSLVPSVDAQKKLVVNIS